MSRQDFVAIAGAIKLSLEQMPDERPVIRNVVANLLPVMRNANPAFKVGTFVAACGLTMQEMSQ
jgi:hypothetical protein